MTRRVVIVSYGVGNIFSVFNALESIGQRPTLSGEPDVIERADALVLPGVGAFSKAMSNLRSTGLSCAISSLIQRGRPILGICLEMQLLMEGSSEFGDHVGLGFIKGRAERIPKSTVEGNALRVPHIGWNEVHVRGCHQPLTHLQHSLDQRHFYFVHSYACNPTDSRDIVATVKYGCHELSAVIRRENIIGVQFHPERSGRNGLNFLKSFVQDGVIV
jgi:glutamine amidotransferase